MKKKTIVHLIDFDGTIYAGDCFRQCCLQAPNLALRILLFFVHGLVFFRILSLSYGKKIGSAILLRARATDGYQSFLVNARFRIYEDLVEEILLTSGDKLIMTASPKFLVEDIVRGVPRLANLRVIGSLFSNQEITHLHGANKRNFIEKNFCCFNVIFWGDSAADLKVLQVVSQFMLCRKGRVIEKILGDSGV